MYNDYFGFAESPFENKLDQKFLFPSEDHEEVLAALLYFVQNRKGFAITCGDVGTGKTMLLNCFMQRLPVNIQIITIANPNVFYQELLQYLAQQLKINYNNKNVLELVDDVREALIKGNEAGKTFVLIVDEAHLLSDQALEDIRLLSNIETADQKLLQILLVGQYELSHKLERPELRQLRQRISISRFLSPLTPVETIQYIDHRLKAVGSSFLSCFNPPCKSLIFKMTGGVPRLINQLCDNALLICMAEQQKLVDRAVLKKAQETLLTDQIFTPRKFGRNHSGLTKFFRFWMPVTACLGLLLGGVWLGQGTITSFYQRLVGGAAASSAAFPAPMVMAVPEKAAKPSRKKAASFPATPQAAPPASDAGSRGQVLEGESPPPPIVSGKTLADPGSLLYSPPKEPVSLEGQPPEAMGKPEPVNKEPASRTKVHQWVVKPGDSLRKIAASWAPENVELGIEAIILANLKNGKEDLIFPGEVLFLPEINFADKIMRLRDNLYYAPYGRFGNFADLQGGITRLSQAKMRYLVINSIGHRGETTHRVILGGYEKKKDLEKDLARLKLGFLR